MIANHKKIIGISLIFSIFLSCNALAQGEPQVPSKASPPVANTQQAKRNPFSKPRERDDADIQSSLENFNAKNVARANTLQNLQSPASPSSPVSASAPDANEVPCKIVGVFNSRYLCRGEDMYLSEPKKDVQFHPKISPKTTFKPSPQPTEKQPDKK